MVHKGGGGTPYSIKKKSVKNWPKISFLSDQGKPGVRSLGPGCPSVRETPCADLTDVTLADEDTKLIQTDNVNRAIPGKPLTNLELRILPK